MAPAADPQQRRRETVYLDNHATTCVDPRVVQAMLPLFSAVYGNAGSAHAFGADAKQALDAAREQLAAAIGAKAGEIVFTGGATESNNLALRGVAARRRTQGRHIVSAATEHPSVLEPLARLAREGFDVTLLPVLPHGDPQAGRVCLEQVAAALRSDTILVSLMLANNEIGAIHPLAEVGALCRARGVLLHTDATQALGRMPIDVAALQIDLASFSAHKAYGPKGVGALYVRRQTPAVRLEPLMEGGGQERGLRSGTLNTPGIVGFGRAAQIARDELPSEAQRLRQLRDRLWAGLSTAIAGLTLHGPSLDRPEWRLPGNLNVGVDGVDGESLLISVPELALSSGAACTSEHPEPSHVLRALGLSDAAARSALRFGLGRFNTPADVDFAVQTVTEAVTRLRRLLG